MLIFYKYFFFFKQKTAYDVRISVWSSDVCSSDLNGNILPYLMRILAKRTLKEFWDRHPRAKRPLATWHLIVGKAVWTGPADVKAMFGAGVDFVGDNRIIFDIGGNKFRLIVHVSYEHKRVLIKFVDRKSTRLNYSN